MSTAPRACDRPRLRADKHVPGRAVLFASREADRAVEANGKYGRASLYTSFTGDRAWQHKRFSFASRPSRVQVLAPTHYRASVRPFRVGSFSNRSVSTVCLVGKARVGASLGRELDPAITQHANRPANAASRPGSKIECRRLWVDEVVCNEEEGWLVGGPHFRRPPIEVSQDVGAPIAKSTAGRSWNKVTVKSWMPLTAGMAMISHHGT